MRLFKTPLPPGEGGRRPGEGFSGLLPLNPSSAASRHLLPGEKVRTLARAAGEGGRRPGEGPVPHKRQWRANRGRLLRSTDGP